jgi:hypothetical protein
MIRSECNALRWVGDHVLALPINQRQLNADAADSWSSNGYKISNLTSTRSTPYIKSREL